MSKVRAGLLQPAPKKFVKSALASATRLQVHSSIILFPKSVQEHLWLLLPRSATRAGFESSGVSSKQAAVFNARVDPPKSLSKNEAKIIHLALLFLLE